MDWVGGRGGWDERREVCGGVGHGYGQDGKGGVGEGVNAVRGGGGSGWEKGW